MFFPNNFRDNLEYSDSCISVADNVCQSCDDVASETSEEVVWIKELLSSVAEGW